jgi:hypothetical protein
VSDRNLERAAFLKSRRRRLTPEQVGLPSSSRRRIGSLRREDVAWLADVGITWYTWLEQGRPIKIAADTLARVATALRLDASESEYLRKLVRVGPKERPHWDEPVSDRVRLLVASCVVGYAFVMGPRWDILSWNQPFAELNGFSGDTDGDPPGFARNGLWLMFTDTSARRLFPNWEKIARRMVATFRVEYADYFGDVGFKELIDALEGRSTEFAAMWHDIDILSPMRWSVGAMRDPRTGHTQSFETVSLCIPENPGQTLVFYIPVQTATATPA